MQAIALPIARCFEGFDKLPFDRLRVCDTAGTLKTPYRRANALPTDDFPLPQIKGFRGAKTYGSLASSTFFACAVR